MHLAFWISSSRGAGAVRNSHFQFNAMRNRTQNSRQIHFRAGFIRPPFERIIFLAASLKRIAHVADRKYNDRLKIGKFVDIGHTSTSKLYTSFVRHFR